MARRTEAPHHPARALTAAVKRIDPTDANAARAVTKSRQAWMDDAWTYFDEVGEAKHAGRYLARSMARLRVVPGYLDEDRRPVTIDDATVARFALDDAYVAACRDALDRIDVGARGGWASLLSRFGLNNFVVGDSWLIGHATDDGEEWGLWSVDEITAREGAGSTPEWFILPGPGAPVDGSAALADPIILRIWTPHPRWYQKSDSPLRGVLDVCDELLILTRAVRAAHLSRLASKVMMLPTTMTGGDGSVTYDANGDPIDNDEAGSPFVRDLHAHFIRPIGDPADPESVAPFIIEADPDDIAAVRVEDLSRDGTGSMAERVQLVERFAQGIDLPVEVVVGKAKANHWSAWQITEDEYRAYVEPPANEFVQAVVAGYYRSALEAAGVAPELASRSTIMLDPTDLVQRPDRSTVTFEAHDRFLVSDAYARDQIGAPEDAAPDDAEIAARVARSPAVKPSLAQPPGSAPQRDAVTAAAPRRRTDLGAVLADLDAALLVRVTAALDGAMRRAIERAGARIRSKAGKTPAADAVRSVDNAAVAATLGPAVVAALDVDTESLFDGAWDDVLGRIDAMILATQTAARRAIAERVADAEPDDPDLTARQDESRRAAVVALGAALTGFAVAAVFHPDPTIERGEAPVALSVPPGLAREALARAGGAHRTGPGGAGIDRNGDPVGEVAAGEDVLRSLVTFGIVRTGYVWRYGDPSSRIGPFEPHEALDGVEFTSWDDDVLTNFDDWPPEPFFYPGDHLWCQCSFEPALDTGEPDEGG